MTCARTLLCLALALPLSACTSSSNDGSASHEAGASDAGTGGTGGGGTLAPCDPLAPDPITLGQVVGVGQDTAGTFYVDSSTGIFLSGGGQLLRQHVIGTGQSGDNEFLFTFVAPGEDYTAARNLLVETTGGTASAMALGPPDSKAFLNESPTGVTPLTIVDAAQVAGLNLVNTPSYVDYLADVSNGNVLLATHPMNEDTSSSVGGLRIYYGPPNAVAERVVTALDQALSGGGTLTFLVDGTSYTLAFAVEQDPDAGPLGGKLVLTSLTPEGGSPLGVTLRDPLPDPLPANLSFLCLS